MGRKVECIQENKKYEGIMRKPKNKRRAMKRAREAMSDYIRERDNWTCISCGKKCDKYNCDAGHLYNATYRNILFSESNVSAQCVYCNKYLQGNWSEYLKHHKEKYGQDEYKRLESIKNVIRKFTIDELFEIEKYFIEKLELLNE